MCGAELHELPNQVQMQAYALAVLIPGVHGRLEIRLTTA